MADQFNTSQCIHKPLLPHRRYEVAQKFSCYEIRKLWYIGAMYKRADKKFKEKIAQRYDEIRREQIVERLAEILHKLRCEANPRDPQTRYSRPS